MSENRFHLTPNEQQIWQREIEAINRHNIWCHCRRCDYEWVDSTDDAVCINCGSEDVKHIACWQFPDD